MINIAAVLTANGIAVLLLTILLFSSRMSMRLRMFDDKLFRFMIISTILQCLVETETFLLDGQSFTGCHSILVLLNSFLYINNIVFSFSWTVYADYKLFSDMKRIKKIYRFVAIPALIIVLLSLVNLCTPIFFSVSAENVYSRTGLYFLPYLLTYCYLAYGVSIIYKYRNKVHKYLFLPAIIFMVPIFICSLIQFFCYGLSLVWVGVAIALTSLYVNVQNEVSYIDQLSGLYTRQYMNHYLEQETKKNGQQRKIAGIMLDIDRFKSINDSFGHLVGDDAISTVGSILHRSVPDNGFAVRFAGDEFMIILSVKDESEILTVISKINSNTDSFNLSDSKPYALHFSAGYSIFDGEDDSIDGFLARIDKKMYDEKKTRVKSRILPERRRDD